MVAKTKIPAEVFKLMTLGFAVIPSGGGPDGKAPIVPWQQYQEGDPPDEKQIEVWIDQLHPSLWGILTGKRAGVVMFGPDSPKGSAIMKEAGFEPHIITPNGEHAYFAHPGFKTKNSIENKDIDSRGDGGFANIFGKNPLTGGEYKIVKMPTPDTLYPWQFLPKFLQGAATDKVAGQRKTKPVAQLVDGARHCDLVSYAGRLRSHGISQEEIDVIGLALNETSENPLPRDEALKILRQYQVPEANTGSNGHKPATIWLDTVEIKNVEFFWNPYVPMGKLTLLEGDPGEGKSWLGCALGAAHSLGSGFPPDFTPTLPGFTLIISAEDGLADTIKPRLAQMGAATGNICALDGLFTLNNEGFEMLEAKVQETNASLLIIDPLVAYLSGELDINKANQVRFSTARLAALADKYNIAIIAVRHLTKGGNLKPLYRGLGSIDFTAAARSVLLAGADPDDPTIRGIAHIKSNLSAKGDTIGYRITNDGFQWLASSTLTADQMLEGSSSSGNALETAKNFLLDALSGGPMVSDDIFREAENQEIMTRTLRRAKQQLHIVSYPETTPGFRGAKKWMMKLPENGGEND